MTNWENLKKDLDENLPDPSKIKIETKEDLDKIKSLIEIAIEKSDTANIPRKKFKSLSSKLPTKRRLLLKVKRKLVKEVSKNNDNLIKADLINEMKSLDDNINQHLSYNTYKRPFASY